MSFTQVFIEEEDGTEDASLGNGDASVNRTEMNNSNFKTQEEDDEQMIEMVRKCPFLFDNNRVDFKDVAKRQHAWEMIGKALGQRPEVVERRWMSLRNQYSKKIREEQTRPFTGSRAQSWRRSHSMAWLKPFIKGRRRRKDILRVGQMSEWTVREQHSQFMSGVAPNGIIPNPAGIPMLALPENISLPRNIEYSIVTPAASNGAASTSSQSPSWSPNRRDHRDEKSMAGGGKSFHGSSSSSSSYVRSFQCANGAPATSNGDFDDASPHAEISPLDNFGSDNENSREYKPFSLGEVHGNQDSVSMMGVVREIVRQELLIEDEDSHFVRSIAHMLKRMSRPKKNRTKVRLLQLLTEIDAEEGD